MAATPDEVASECCTGRVAVEAILNAYAIVFFGRHRGLGAALLVATFLAPTAGLFGLAGTAIAFVAARWLGFNDAGIRSGESLFNSLIVSLALAYLTDNREISPLLLATLLLAVSLAALLLSVALNHAARQLLGLPALSVPFVILTVSLYLLARAQAATPNATEALSCLIREPTFLPAAVAAFFLALGTVMFLPLTPVGIVVFVALLCYSRLLLLTAAIGFVSGWAFLNLIHWSGGALEAAWLGANFVLCGIALGSIFFVPSRGSLMLAGVGSIFCTLAAIAINAVLSTYKIPPLSLPFILVVLPIVSALRRREHFRELFENPYVDLTPEAVARRFNSVRERFPASHLPAFFLPFADARVVTQGFDGKITHTRSWRHALDFEVLDERGESAPAQRSALEDNYSFGSSVLAPCDGTVVNVVNHVPDNPLGTQNVQENWGNFVVLASDAGACVALCHFKQNGVAAVMLQRVGRGQLLGYCGNSGRSPLPHLHMQVQVAAWPGAATIPFRIRHYIEIGLGAKRIFHVLGVPAERTTIAPLVEDRDIAACFEASLGTRVRYRTESDGKPVGSETIETSLTGCGQVLFRSLESRTTLRASMIDGVFIAHELDGFRGSILSMLRLGLSLVPFSRDRGVQWTDSFDPRPLRRTLAGWAADLIEPFFGIGFVELHQRFTDTHVLDEIAVTTEIGSDSNRASSSMPRRIDVRLSRERGLVELTVTRAAGVVRIVPEMSERMAGAS